MDTCFKLDKAQPSLGLNLLRPDGERFFAYQSQALKRDFPAVIRIVDRVKEHWREKIHALAQELMAKRGPDHAGDNQSGQVLNTSVRMDGEEPVEVFKPAGENLDENRTDSAPTSETIKAGIKDDSQSLLADPRESDSQVRPAADAGARRGRPRETHWPSESKSSRTVADLGLQLRYSSIGRQV